LFGAKIDMVVLVSLTLRGFIHKEKSCNGRLDFKFSRHFSQTADINSNEIDK